MAGSARHMIFINTSTRDSGFTRLCVCVCVCASIQVFLMYSYMGLKTFNCYRNIYKMAMIDYTYYKYTDK